MRLLVTVGSRFLGGYVLRAAVNRGYDMVALARPSAAARTVIARRAQTLLVNLDDPGLLASRFAAVHCDVLVDLASGFGHGPGIVAAAREAAPSRAVFGSTTAATTTLSTPSKRVRLEAEKPIRSSGLDWTILRPTMIYGAPGDRNLSRPLALLAEGKAFAIDAAARDMSYEPRPFDDGILAEAVAMGLPR